MLNTGRKGPVLVDVPKDVTANKTEFVQTIPERPRTFEIRNPEKVRVVQEMIKNAKRPMIYAGGGIISADASEEFKAFAELIDAPVCCSLMGLGCIPADHPLCVGNIGMHGGYETGMATAECDLMIACGEDSPTVLQATVKGSVNRQRLFSLILTKKKLARM